VTAVRLRSLWNIAVEAFRRFNADDAWAIASHIALSALMALFPFLLVLTAIASFVGSRDLADEGARILLEAWPEEVAGPLALEVQGVLSSARGGVLTVGAALALFFASSGVESLRIGLNRAYNLVDSRPWWLLRLEAILYVIVGAFGLLALSFFVFLGPLIWETALRYFPNLQQFNVIVTFARFAVASVVLLISLFILHLWLPAGRRSFLEITPGIIATMILWLLAGSMFGRYLAEFAFTYSRYYAGLASPMIALVFLYLTSAIFIYGGELNHVICVRRRERELEKEAAENPPPPPLNPEAS
jgi:membrane protein